MPRKPHHEWETERFVPHSPRMAKPSASLRKYYSARNRIYAIHAVPHLLMVLALVVGALSFWMTTGASLTVVLTLALIGEIVAAFGLGGMAVESTRNYNKNASPRFATTQSQFSTTLLFTILFVALVGHVAWMDQLPQSLVLLAPDYIAEQYDLLVWLMRAIALIPAVMFLGNLYWYVNRLRAADRITHP